MDVWVRLPTGWIIDGKLRNLRWRHGQGSDATAALMVLSVIAHNADQETGIARVTYEQFEAATSLSRTKLAGGLRVLRELGVIAAGHLGRSVYRLAGYDPGAGWGKFPAKRLYADDLIRAFRDFKLRRIAELNALKLFFLLVAMRDRKTNFVRISWEKIEAYTGVDGDYIRTAISLLVSLGLVHVEQMPTDHNERGVSNIYRIVHIDSYKHMGTSGRGLDPADLAEKA